MDLQQEIDIIVTAASQFCEDFKEALEKFLDEINEACASMQEAWEELQKYAYDCIEESKKKAGQRKQWRRETRVLLRPLMVDKRMKIHHCRNAC